jgi:hypothetical protein
MVTKMLRMVFRTGNRTNISISFDLVFMTDTAEVLR